MGKASFKLVASITLLSLALAGLPPIAAHAASIVVNTAVDEDTANADCSLREAIIAANTNAAYRGCSAGAGTDTITFAGDYTITLTTGSQLPVISSAMFITGNGEANTILQASECNPVTLPGSCTPAQWRLFTLDASADLTLTSLTMRYGNCGGGLCAGPSVSYLTDGGAIYNWGGILNLSNVTLNSNVGRHGGAVRQYLNAATFSQTTFAGNSSLYGGGAVYAENVTTTFTDSLFQSNTADASIGVGGAVYLIFGGTTTLTGVTFAGNSAYKAGALLNTASSATLTNVTFYNNSAGYQGGAIYNYSSPTLMNVTFAGNSAPAGKAMANETGSPNLTNVILWDGGTGGNKELNNFAGITSAISFGVVQGGCPTATTCTSVITTDPLLGSLGNNGGATPTMALGAGSSALDAGTNTGCPAIDQRGVTRPQGATCDIGAYEVEYHSISGNAGIAGATLSYTNGGAQTATADSGGDYAFTVPSGWSGTVTPSLAGYGFSPASRTYADVAADQPSEDYTATPLTYTISGNAGVAGATLFYLDSNPKTVVSDVDGLYSLTVPYGWSGVVTPSKAGYGFTPISTTYISTTADQVSQDYTAAVAPLEMKNSFDTDVRSDIAYWRPSTGVWSILHSDDGFDYGSPQFVSWGSSTDVAVPGDYDGDGKTDIAVRTPPSGGQSAAYLILKSSVGYDFGQTLVVPAGWPGLGDTPVPADYNGDGITDPAIFRGNTGVWIIPLSPNFNTFQFRAWGASGDKPFGGDIDGDGTADIGYWRPSTGSWGFLLSSYGFSYGSPAFFSWGTSTDAPELADFDGDGKADPSFVTPPANGQSAAYRVLKSTTSYNFGQTGTIAAGWPGLGDTPVPQDYDGDGMTDAGIWRGSSGVWIIPKSSAGNSSFIFAAWGASGDQVVK